VRQKYVGSDKKYFGWKTKNGQKHVGPHSDLQSKNEPQPQ